MIDINDYHAVTESIATTIAKGAGKPLTKNQKIVLWGALVVWLEKAKKEPTMTPVISDEGVSIQVAEPVLIDPSWLKPGAVVPINEETVATLLKALQTRSMQPVINDDSVSMACEIGDYGLVEPRQMATVIFQDKKIAECYSNEDAKFVLSALLSAQEKR